MERHEIVSMRWHDMARRGNEGASMGGWDGHGTYQSVGLLPLPLTQLCGCTPRASTDLGEARYEVSEQASG
jgi:hypothetical protein